MMDQTTGNSTLPTSIVSSSGSRSVRASHTPSRAPMNPSTMDTISPPGEKPLMICPSAAADGRDDEQDDDFKNGHGMPRFSLQFLTLP